MDEQKSSKSSGDDEPPEVEPAVLAGSGEKEPETGQTESVPALALGSQTQQDGGRAQSTEGPSSPATSLHVSLPVPVTHRVSMQAPPFQVVSTMPGPPTPKPVEASSSGVRVSKQVITTEIEVIEIKSTEPSEAEQTEMETSDKDDTMEVETLPRATLTPSQHMETDSESSQAEEMNVLSEVSTSESMVSQDPTPEMAAE